MPAHVLSARLDAAARGLGAACPSGVVELAALLARAAAVDPRAATLVPGRRPIEVSFAERTPDWLRLDFEPDAPGPFVGAVLDAGGLCAIKLYRAIGDGGEDAVARAAAAQVAPYVRVMPHLRSTAWHRGGDVAARVYLRCPEGFALSQLAALAGAMGLAAHAPRLARAVMVLAGAAAIEPDGAVIGVRRIGAAWELKVDVFPRDGDPDQRAAVVEALLADGDGGVPARRAFARWRRAVGPAEIATVGVTAAPGQPLACNAYAYPAWSEPS